MALNPRIIFKIFLPALIVTMCSHFGFTQGLMEVSDNLLRNGTAYPVKWKGFPNFNRFEFHIYKVFSGKTGTTKSKFNSKLFSSVENGSSTQNGYFELASQRGDTAVVNFSRNFDYRALKEPSLVIGGESGTFSIETDREILNSEDNFVALIETSPTGSAWRLVIIKKDEIENEANFYGWITDGVRTINIKAVYRYQNPGKKNMMDHFLGGELWHKGFEFLENDKSLGAVQLGPNKKQLIVWLSNDLDSFNSFLVATASIALLNEYFIMANF